MLVMDDGTVDCESKGDVLLNACVPSSLVWIGKCCLVSILHAFVSNICSCNFSTFGQLALSLDLEIKASRLSTSMLNPRLDCACKDNFRRFLWQSQHVRAQEKHAWRRNCDDPTISNEYRRSKRTFSIVASSAIHTAQSPPLRPPLNLLPFWSLAYWLTPQPAYKRGVDSSSCMEPRNAGIAQYVSRTRPRLLRSNAGVSFFPIQFLCAAAAT